MTRYEWLILAALVLSVSQATSALGWDGNEYLKVPPVARVAYVAGVVDAYVNLRAAVETKRSSTPGYVLNNFEGVMFRRRAVLRRCHTARLLPSLIST